MIAFIIKSTVSLLVIYTLYKVFLAEENIPFFKRCFLLFGILFSICISLVSIKTGLPILPDTISYSAISSQLSETYFSDPEISVYESDRLPSIYRILCVIYFLVTVFLMFRYVYNVIRLINKGKNNRSYIFEGYRVVVLGQSTPPYSFLNTIYVDDECYDNGSIKKEILLHELTHIKQKHSIDILLIEFIQIIFWFNPLLWFYKKEIKLNHEYLADKKVVDLGVRVSDYQNIILSFAFRNNSSYLASNFNYSSIKKRFIMLAKEKSSKRVFMKGAFIAPAIILLALMMSFNQTIMAIDKEYEQDDWWQPILEKHNVKGKAYNNFGDVFEMGDQNSLKNNISTMTNATMIVRGSNNNYLFIQASHVEHNIKTGALKFKSVKMQSYKMDSDVSKPLSVVEGGDVTMNINDIVRSNLFQSLPSTN